MYYIDYMCCSIVDDLVLLFRVSEILDNQINVSYGSWKGRVHATMVTDDMTEVHKIW